MTNFDSRFTYTASTTAGTASVGSTGTVSVTGLTPGTTATVTVRTSRSGYLAGSGTLTGSPSTGAARNPLFSPPTPTVNGFTVQVSNYDATFQWSVTATPGSATINQSGLVTVVNVSPGTAASVTVTTTKSGFTSGTGTTRGTAKVAAAPTPTRSSQSSTQAPTQSFIRPPNGTKKPKIVKKSGTSSKKPVIGKKPSGTHAIIITCSNGSTTKRIVGYNPKCPAGFTRKG
jgi:titin